MATFTNTGTNNVKLMYKLASRRYGVGSGEVNYIDTPTETSFPWDEVLVGPGVTVNLGDLSWQKVVDMGPVPPAAVVRVGPQRGVATDIVNKVVDINGNRNNIKVLFKLKGKRYNVGSGENGYIDTPTETTYPWEEAIVGPDRAFYVTDDVEWTKVINMPVNPKVDEQVDRAFSWGQNN